MDYVAFWCIAHQLELALKDALKGTFFSEMDEMLLLTYYLYGNLVTSEESRVGGCCPSPEAVPTALILKYLLPEGTDYYVFVGLGLS